jgi:hypothetical protein
MVLADISRFERTGDYVALLNGALCVEIVVIFLTLRKIIVHSKFLTIWYHRYGLLAVLADVLIVIIGLLITRYVYKFFFKAFDITRFIAVALGVQVIHDVTFYAFFTAVPRGTNGMLDLFKDYAKEMGAFAVLGDSFIILFSCLMASYFAALSLNTNIVLLVIFVYMIPYVLQFLYKN